MTEVLHSPPSSSSPSSSSSLSNHNETFFQTLVSVEEVGGEQVEVSRATEGGDGDDRDKDGEQLSLLALLITLFRKSFLVPCKTDREELRAGMEIGWPTNVRHVAHVTFDRFNGFLGLPVEFEPEVPRRAPSASATVFGVSTESMQLSYDSRGNSVPTILLLMQRHLYIQGGLQAEGIFRINAENSQEEYVRDRLNRGVIPEGIDVHCLAGLIKAWFRELPTGVLDSLSSEQVMQCQSEDEYMELVSLLPQTEAALLDWAINLMADVVQEEHSNKMDARNIAMVFAPNMTQMADPLTALMYAVQVMNFLKTLIEKTLRERAESIIDPSSASHLEPYDENGHQSPFLLCAGYTMETNPETLQDFIEEEPSSESASESNPVDNITGEEDLSHLTYTRALEGNVSHEHDIQGDVVDARQTIVEDGQKIKAGEKVNDSKLAQTSDSDHDESLKFRGQPPSILGIGLDSKGKVISNLACINSRSERIEAWW